MSSQGNATANTKDITGSRRRSSATMGNVANELVDRSSETVLTRKQKRANRRSTLRMQSEVAPFLGMDFSDEEDGKDKTQVGDKKEDEQESEMKDEEPKKDGKDEAEAEKEK